MKTARYQFHLSFCGNDGSECQLSFQNITRLIQLLHPKLIILYICKKTGKVIFVLTTGNQVSYSPWTVFWRWKLFSKAKNSRQNFLGREFLYLSYFNHILNHNINTNFQFWVLPLLLNILFCCFKDSIV